VFNLNLAKKLFLLPPRAYAIAYLAAIPAFATLYWQFSQSSFYAPYARYESVAADDARASGLVIQRRLRDVLGSLPKDIQGWQIWDFRIFDVRTSGVKLQFTVVVALGEKKDFFHTIPMYIHCNIDGDELTETRRIEQNSRSVMYKVHIENDESQGDTDKFPRYWDVVREFFLISSVDHDGALYLGAVDDAVLQSLFAGIRGDPTRFSKSFLRMLYFSVTVITTIGFGDIVPMTPLARFSVAIEGMLGIVLAGLFVNAAAVSNRNN
jgi:Ion channel